MVANLVPVTESFPRMWDQPTMVLALTLAGRIIPTYVGSTPACLLLVSFPPNHSHVCGINGWDAALATLVIESFPRMWDQRVSDVAGMLELRIIPTYVGSTQQRIFR